MQDRHLPTAFFLGGASSSVHAAGASMQQHPLAPSAAQLPGHAIEGVSFADAAEIDLDSGLAIAHRAALGVQHHLVHASASAGRFSLFFTRHSSRSPEKSPCLD